MKRNIILCGFMGCGKTTVGKELAQAGGYGFVDMDAYIEERQGLTVPQIFQQLGEPEFRRMEREACWELSQKAGLVVAAGGGALTFPENARVLRATGTIILLEVPLEVLYERLKNDTGRPLLQRPDRRQAVEELFEKRMPLYRSAADLTVDAGVACRTAAARVLDAVKHWEEKKA